MTEGLLTSYEWFSSAIIVPSEPTGVFVAQGLDPLRLESDCLGNSPDHIHRGRAATCEIAEGARHDFTSGPRRSAPSGAAGRPTRPTRTGGGGATPQATSSHLRIPDKILSPTGRTSNSMELYGTPGFLGALKHGRGANHDTRGRGQETAQVRSPNLPFDQRRRSNDRSLSSETDDLCSLRLGRCCFYIQEGKVKLTVVSKSSKEATIGILKDGDFFGEGCLTRQLLGMYSATALTDCTVMRIDKKSMMDVIHRESAFSDRFVAYLLTRKIRYEENLVDQLFNSSEKRLARVLLLLAHFGKQGKQEVAIPIIRHETLAEMVDTTRARHSFFMNRFRKLGFVRYDDELAVHSSLLNVVLQD